MFQLYQVKREDTIPNRTIDIINMDDIISTWKEQNK